MCQDAFSAGPAVIADHASDLLLELARLRTENYALLKTNGKLSATSTAQDPPALATVAAAIRTMENCRCVRFCKVFESMLSKLGIELYNLLLMQLLSI